MFHIVADTLPRRLPFYLALEEWAAKTLPPEEYFFTWRVEPTVIFGRNQAPELEVNLEYCRDNGIQVYRRRSGGGCVYADLDNLMISYITPSTQVTATFADYTRRMAQMLVSLGVDAKATGRNDITVDGHKVSGNAFYHIPGRSIVHGTMLWKADVEKMRHAITPSRSKMESKKVASVESRITNLSQYLPDMTLDSFNRYLIDYFTTGSYTLSAADISAVEKIEEGYYDLRWIFGRRGLLGTPKGMRRILRRIEGVGEIDMALNIADDIITDIDLRGDFFLLSDLDSTLLDKLRGCRLSEAALATALADTDVSATIAGLTNDSLVRLIIDNTKPIKPYKTQ